MIVMELLGGLGGEVVEVLVGTFGVGPDDPFGGGDLDLVDVAPGALPADEFVLERPDGGLGQRVVQRVTDRSDRGSTPSAMSRWVKATEVYWAPASLCAIRPRKSVLPSWARVKNACSTASRTRSVVIDLAARQPTIRRL